MIGKESNLAQGKTPLLALSTQYTGGVAPPATLAGNLKLTGGDITRLDADLHVSSVNGHVQIENVVVDGDDTITPGDLTLTKPTASITHTGATSLNISTSQANAKVYVEDTEFQGPHVTTTTVQSHLAR